MFSSINASSVKTGSNKKLQVKRLEFKKKYSLKQEGQFRKISFGKTILVIQKVIVI